MKKEEAKPQKLKETEHTELRKATNVAEHGEFVLRLYVAGNSSRSRGAVENLKKICNEHVEGRFKLEVIDIYQQPIFAKEGQIVAAPALIKALPCPLRRLIGDLSNEARVLAGPDLHSPKE
jgi:circadian clock protein KaiB